MTPTVVPVNKLQWCEVDHLERVTIARFGSSYLIRQALREKRLDIHHFSSFTISSLDIPSVKNTNIITHSSYQTRKKNYDKTEKIVKNKFDLLNLSSEQLDSLSYYDILGGIPIHSSVEKIRKAFHMACLKYHPDKIVSNISKKNEERLSEICDGCNLNSHSEKEDPIFLKIKEAFDILSDTSKRRSYDSTLDFDDSIPLETKNSDEFYRIFGKCFKMNLRFAVDNYRERYTARGYQKAIDSSGEYTYGGIKNRKKKRNNGFNNNSRNSSMKDVTELGNDSTPIDEVHAFYDYWTNFESWRDFTIPAAKHTSHNIDMAEGRYEKRWMEREIMRQAKILKREEMSRISKLVQTAMSCDPRLRKEKLRLEREKEDRTRMVKEKKEYEDSIRTEKENNNKKKQLEKQEKERKERLRMKFEKERERKEMRKIRQTFRKSVSTEMKRVSDINNDNRKYFLLHNVDNVYDDIELICEIFSREDFDTFNSKQEQMLPLLSIITLSPLLDLIRFHANKLREKIALIDRKKEQLKEEARIFFEGNERKEKALRVSCSWSKDELSALSKAVRKYPSGVRSRWDSISEFVNHLCKSDKKRSKQECIEKYNQIHLLCDISHIKSKVPVSGINDMNITTTTKTVFTNTIMVEKSDRRSENDSHIFRSLKLESISISNWKSSNWTKTQNNQLEEGLKKYPVSMDTNERWSNISKCVSGKGKRECVERFKLIRRALLKDNI